MIGLTVFTCSECSVLSKNCFLCAFSGHKKRVVCDVFFLLFFNRLVNKAPTLRENAEESVVGMKWDTDVEAGSVRRFSIILCCLFFSVVLFSVLAFKIHSNLWFSPEGIKFQFPSLSLLHLYTFFVGALITLQLLCRGCLNELRS